MHNYNPVIMIAPCETVSKEFLPALKAATAVELSKNGFSQVRIAGELGVTQAQVSKYLAGKYSNEIKKLSETEKFKAIGSELAILIKKNVSVKELNNHTCDFCESFNNHSNCYLRYIAQLGALQ